MRARERCARGLANILAEAPARALTAVNAVNNRVEQTGPSGKTAAWVNHISAWR